MKKRNNVTFQSAILNPLETKPNVLTDFEAPEGSGLLFPKKGLNVLFGIQSSVTAINDLKAKSQREATSEQSFHLEPVIIHCVGEKPDNDPYWYNTYENKTIFNMERLKTGDHPQDKNILKEITDFYYDCAVSDYGTTEINRNFKRGSMRILEHFPQYLDNLIDEMDWAKELDVIIWKARYGEVFNPDDFSTMSPGEVTKRATILNTKCITDLYCNNSKFEVLLPDI